MVKSIIGEDGLVRRTDIVLPKFSWGQFSIPDKVSNHIEIRVPSKYSPTHFCQIVEPYFCNSTSQNGIYNELHIDVQFTVFQFYRAESSFAP